MNNSITKAPIVSVILSVYNGESYISESIESILNQTFRDFELIIINDGSIDRTSEKLKSYTDSRIINLENEKNIGIARSSNKGLRMARGRYIAIMDADDISLPERFQEQFSFLENNPDIGVCGTWINVIDKNGKWMKNICYPTSSDVISCSLLFYDCFVNPTTMFRKKIIEDIGEYNPGFIAAMDYDLWTRMIGQYKFSNLPDFLLKYRMHGQNISHDRKKRHHEDYLIRKTAIEKFLGYPLSMDEDIALSIWIDPQSKLNLNQIFLIDSLISIIYQKFIVTNKLSDTDIREINLFFADQLFLLALQSKQIPKIERLRLIIHGFGYRPAIFPLLRKIFSEIRKFFGNG